MILILTLPSHRNSFRRYASFRSNLNEILYEEDEEEEVMEEKPNKEPSRIPFSFRSTFGIFINSLF